MVEAAGIEPAPALDSGLAKAGQVGSKVGRYGSEVGQAEGVAVRPVCKSRTERGHFRARAGRCGSIAGAQRREPTVGNSQALELLVGVWPELPEAARKAILAVARAFQKTLEEETL